MLRSELYELEKTIAALITTGGAADKNSYQKQITEQVNYIRGLCLALKDKWTRELLNNAKEQVIKRYIQYHQAGILQLADAISKHVQLEGKELYSPINAALEDILHFLRHRFYPYFDPNHQATIYSCEQLLIKVTAYRKEFSGLDQQHVDRSLIEVILSSADEIANEGSISGVSFRQVEQAINVVQNTHQLCQFGTTTERLIRALYQQNFNSSQFYRWFEDYLDSRLKKNGDEKANKDFLNELLNDFKGIFVNPEKNLQPEIPPTDVFIIDLLNERSTPVRQSNYIKPSAAQFPLNLSVPQFAMFIRIFYKSGCFPVENIALITRFFSDHFTTKKQPQISRKSFGRAFYSLDQSTAAVVRDYLQKMLNYLNKTYFP